MASSGRFGLWGASAEGVAVAADRLSDWLVRLVLGRADYDGRVVDFNDLRTVNQKLCVAETFQEWALDVELLDDEACRF